MLRWATMMHRVVTAAIAIALAIGCGPQVRLRGEPETTGDEPNADDGDGGSTDGLGATGGFSGDDSGSSESTGAPALPGNARALAWTQEPDAARELWLIEYVDGELAAPRRLSDPGEGVLAPMFAQARRYVAYRTGGEAPVHRVIDLAETAAGAPSSIAIGQTEVVTAIAFVPGRDAIVYVTDDALSSRVWRAEIEAGVVQAAALIAGPSDPGETFDLTDAFADDGAWTLLTLDVGHGPISNQLVLAALDEPDPSALVTVSDHTSPIQWVARPVVVPGKSSVVYESNRDYSAGELFYVALPDTEPQPPLRLHAPLVPYERVGTPIVSPTGHGLVFAIGDALAPNVGPLYWVALDDPDPAPPAAIGPQIVGLASPTMAWSSDGRWLVYHAAPAPSGPVWDVWIVNVGGPQPGTPVRIGSNDGQVVHTVMFDPTGAYLVYRVSPSLTSAQGEIVRIDVSGDAVGEAQTIVAGSDLHDSIAFVSDGTAIVVALDDALYRVPLDGPVPGAPVLVSTLPPAVTLGGPWVSADDSVVLAWTYGSDVLTLRLYDAAIASPVEAFVGAGAIWPL